MNDGVFLEDELYVVGSMAKNEPEKNPGFIYKINNGKIKDWKKI